LSLPKRKRLDVHAAVAHATSGNLCSELGSLTPLTLRMFFCRLPCRSCSYSTVIGGQWNTAFGTNSLAAGNNAVANDDFSAVLGFDSDNGCASMGTGTVNVCVVADGFFVNGEEMARQIQVQLLHSALAALTACVVVLAIVLAVAVAIAIFLLLKAERKVVVHPDPDNRAALAASAKKQETARATPTPTPKPVVHDGDSENGSL
jgi:hypothetical protein